VFARPCFEVSHLTRSPLLGFPVFAYLSWSFGDCFFLLGSRIMSCTVCAIHGAVYLSPCEPALSIFCVCVSSACERVESNVSGASCIMRRGFIRRVTNSFVYGPGGGRAAVLHPFLVGRHYSISCSLTLLPPRSSHVSDLVQSWRYRSRNLIMSSERFFSWKTLRDCSIPL